MTQIAVALGSHPKMGVILAAANRRAVELGKPWHVVYVETPTHVLRDDDHKQAILRYVTRAEEMGAHIHRVEADKVADGLASFVDSLGAESLELYVGRTTSSTRGSLYRQSMYEQLRSRLPSNVVIHAIALSGRSPSSDMRIDIFRMRAVKLRHMGYAVLSVFLAYLFTEALRATMSVAEFTSASYNTNVIFMLPPVIMALRYGLIPGLTASLCSFLTLNYFYIYPIYQLDVTDYQDMVNLVLFLASTVLMALLGSYSFAYTESIQRRERRVQTLFAINDVISQSSSRSEALAYIHRTITKLLEMDAAILLPPMMNPDTLEMAYPKEQDMLNSYDWDAIKDCWKHLRTTGCGTPRFTLSPWRFEPMITGQDRFGVLGIKLPPKCDIDASFGQLVAALADQAASVLQRIELSKEVEDKRVSEEREKLRSMLLSSVSHDLKTPLASIIGSLSVYHGMFDSLPEDKKRELTETALDEAHRLDSFITNILDMTRIESGQVQFKKELVEPGEVVKRVMKRLKQRLRHHQVEVNMAGINLQIEADPMMLEQVLMNVVDNAAKYTPAKSQISLSYVIEDDHVQIIVRDTGPGIPENKLEHIFDKYERLRERDSRVAGTGLGLAIVKAIMEAQGGWIKASNHPQGGAIFTLGFPDYQLQEETLEAACH